MRAAKELLHALNDLHKGGFVHRDLTGRNILWGLTENARCNADIVATDLGLPKVLERTATEKPYHLVAPVDFPPHLISESIQICDFGMIVRADEAADIKGFTPQEHRAPELDHRFSASAASDVWSFTCVFSKLYMGIVSFQGYPSYTVEVLGPFPQEWHSQYTAGKSDDSWYNPDTLPKDYLSLLARIKKRNKDADGGEQERVSKFMHRASTYEPDCRPTAAELLSDPLIDDLIKRYT
ncbi:kinase-like protein [Ophiobolus disseminans]|uniref:Kinase-like protein n=1 Tax=Ophiobolus disseminans TaxID=1469910 RepID=A0A6A6ZPY1_9PLEO|nr:kinase-like protein [Ophiobolus disseminans]